MSTRQLRVLMVTTDFPPSLGGIQQWTAQLASQLSTRHAVTVVAPRYPGSAAYDAAAPYDVVRYRQSRRRPLALGALALTTLREVLRQRPDVVLFSHIFAAFAAHPFCRKLGIPYVVAAHGLEIQARRVQRFLGAILRHGARCIAVSRHTALLLQDKGIPPAAITVVGNGVHAGLLTAAPRPGTTQHQRIAGDGPVILTLARLDERYKGHDMMLQALPLIRARVPDVTYVITGDGRYRHYYERLATALGVRDHVIFTGRVTDEERLALYDRCDLFALISREVPDGGCEGFGIVFLEAAARGKPAVGGRSGGVPDAIADGVTGLLVEPTDVDAIADACVRLLTDRDLAQRMGCSGRERVRTAYTWEHIARQVDEILQSASRHTKAAA